MSVHNQSAVAGVCSSLSDRLPVIVAAGSRERCLDRSNLWVPKFTRWKTSALRLQTLTKSSTPTVVLTISNAGDDTLRFRTGDVRVTDDDGVCSGVADESVHTQSAVAYDALVRS